MKPEYIGYLAGIGPLMLLVMVMLYGGAVEDFINLFEPDEE